LCFPGSIDSISTSHCSDNGEDEEDDDDAGFSFLRRGLFNLATLLPSAMAMMKKFEGGGEQLLETDG
jgi:hypothetical protein